MLGANVVVVQAASFVNSQLDHAFRPWSETDLAHDHAVSTPDDELHRRAHFIQFYAQVVEHASRHTVPFAHQSQEYVLRSYVVVIEALSFFLCKL